ncbi:MAG: ShET2/EspL2 family type secretion system effector toxin [Solimicrobium sp.]|jgi:hypothetical protein|nr:ShET2/EspL2 family type secretion system effector toxin [Solimicrobium sp.]
MAGLGVAVLKGNAETVQAWDEVLQGISPLLTENDLGVLAEFLVKSEAERTSGLCYALANGQANSIKAYSKLLQGIVPYLQATGIADLVGVITAKNIDGILGLHFALKEGHADALEAYGNLLLNVFQQLPWDKRGILFDLLNLMKKTITPEIAVRLGLSSNHARKLDVTLTQLISKWEDNAREEII